MMDTFNAELQSLLQEVTQLRKETDSIRCNCNLPDCPFSVATESLNSKDSMFDESEKESPDLGFGSMEAIYQQRDKKKVRYSLPPAMPLKLTPPPPSRHRRLTPNSVSLTCIPRGVQKRADGTILENDYPGFYRRSQRKNGMISGFSMSHLNRLDVNFLENDDDCLVDQDGLISSNDDYMFRREAPERRLRRNWRRESSANTLSHATSHGTFSRQASDDAVLRHASIANIETSTLEKLANFVKSQCGMKRHSAISH